MKKILNIFLIIASLIFFREITFSNSDAGRGGGGGGMSTPIPPICTSIVKIDSDISLTINNHIDDSCKIDDFKDDIKDIKNVEIHKGNFSKVGLSGYRKRADGTFETSGTCETRNRVFSSTMSISTSELFPTFLGNIKDIEFKQNIRAGSNVNGSRTFGISEPDFAFLAAFTKNYGDRKSTCTIKCSKGEDGKKKITKECTDIKLGGHPGETIMPGLVRPKIEVSVENSSNCMKKGDRYFCYANEENNFNLVIKEKGNPSGVNVLRSYVLNSEGTDCATPRVDGYCQHTDIQTRGGKFTFKHLKFKEAGEYVLEFNGFVTGNNGSVINRSDPFTLNLTIVPNPNTIKKDIPNSGDFKFETRRNNGIPTAIGNPYANLKDEYKYIFDVKDGFGNQIDNNKFSGLTYTGVSTPTPVGGKHWVQLDQVGAVNGSNKDISFVVFSGQPGEYTEKFNVKLKHWNPDGSLSGRNIETLIPSVPNKRNFKEVIDSLKIEVKEPKSNTWDGSPQVGTEQNYRLLLQDIKENGNTVLLGGNISNGKVTGGLKDKVKFVGDSEGKYKFTEFNQIGNSFTFNPENVNLQFTALFDVLAQNEFLKTPSLGIKSKEVEVNYDIRNGNRSYNGAKSLLSEIGINSCEVPTVGVKIIGNMQNFGKDGTTATNKFTDISKSDMAGIVSKNANDLIRNMKSGTTVNGVRYEVKNVTISGGLQEETLIVKGGNVFINNNLNTSGKKLGIIVLSENGKGGNIFVTNNVSNINAFIYAEGSIRSAKDENGTLTYEDKDLLNKLDIKGSLFTKNTIGGAINSGEGFLLPGGVKTTDFKEAQKYDLNFMRKVPFSCSWSEEEKANYYSVKIEYDQKIQSNPPKGFTK